MNEEDANEEKQPLDYIFSVEILNEGVDIVEVNQVVMLRPTQSPIVFIQQLGRGLRKANGKDRPFSSISTLRILPTEGDWVESG